LFARANIALGDAKQVLVVPLTAVSYNPYGNSVYVILPSEENKEVLVVRRRFIKTGEARGDLVEVVEGLKAGEEVATSGLLKLQNNSVVIINNSVMPDASLNPTPSDS
jgi:membrane fusion protein (multidrug efflux system)